MNILIKNADFSEVSVGKSGQMNKSATIKNCYFRYDNFSYGPWGNQVLCFDVSGLSDGAILKVTAYANDVSNNVCRWYSASCPTSDVTCANESDATSFGQTMGTPIRIDRSEDYPSGGGFVTKKVDVPEGANTLLIYVSDEPQNSLVVEIFNLPE